MAATGTASIANILSKAVAATLMPKLVSQRPFPRDQELALRPQQLDQRHQQKYAEEPRQRGLSHRSGR
jgi:hypothetical protein